MKEKDKEKKAFTLDNTTTASNPGDIKFEPLVWFLHRKFTVSVFVALLTLTLWLSVKVSYFLLFFSALMIYVNAYYWVRVKEHFTADSNPGMIISVSPPLYAVYTDLSKGNGYYPAVKVIPYRGRKAININDRLPTVALYFDEDEDSPHWSDFNPLPVEYATSDKASIEGELSSYRATDWENLTAGLSLLPKALKVGLYPLKTADSDW